MKKLYVIIIVLSTLFILSGCQLYQPSSVSNTPTTTENSVSQSTEQASKLLAPIAEFQQRITKKPFGLYITPQTSPIQPERFSGYHTGVDVEYIDATTTVPVFAVADGTIKYSGLVNGYGGVEILSFKLNNQDYLALYGHLKPSSLIANNTNVRAGEQIAVLGQGYSTETDGEREHLHFAIYLGTDFNFKGYVQNQTELKNWLDPLNFY